LRITLSRQEVVWSIAAVVLFALSFLVKFSADNITTRAYHAGNIKFLQTFVPPPEPELDNLDYYVGEMDAGLFGPLAVTLAGAGFLILALVFFRESSAFVFGAAVFIYLLITKWQALFYPPYGDAVGGPLAEAIWLLRHSFDYSGLWNQPPYMEGGPKVYFFTIYPTVMALLMKALPTIKSFIVVSHLLTFAAVSVIAALYRKIAARVLSPALAVMTAVMFLSVPISLSMFEAINMEVPVLLAAMISVVFLVEKRIVPAALFAVLTAYTKGPGILICGAVVFCALIWAFTAERIGEKIKYVVCALVVAALTVLKIFAALTLTYQYASAQDTAFLSGWASLKSTWIFYLFVVFTLIFVAKLIVDFRHRKTARLTTEEKGKNRIVFVMFTVMLMWFVLFLNQKTVSPRYSFILMPFIIFCGVWAVLYAIRNQKAVGVILAGVILISLINSYGLFYPPIDGYNYVLEERSLAYRNDLKLTQQIAEVVTDDFSRFHIGAPFIIGQTLAMPEFGYVRKPLDVTMYGWPIKYGGIKPFRGLRTMNISQTLWVGVRSGLPDNIPFPTGPDDVILKRINVGHQKAVFFIGGYAIERVRRLLERK